MHALTVLSIVLMIATVRSANKPVCHLRELDLCMTLSAGNNKMPVTDEELDKQCGVLQEMSDCFSWFLQNCATTVQRDILSMLTEGASRVQKSYCTKGEPLRREYLKHAPCLAKFATQGSHCIEDVKAGLQMMEKAKFSDRVSSGCCVYTRYNQCAVKVVETNCGEEAVEYGNIFIRLVASNLPDVLCQGFANNTICDTLLPPPGTKADPQSRGMVSRLFSLYYA